MRALDDFRRSLTAQTGYPVQIQLVPLSDNSMAASKSPPDASGLSPIHCSSALPPFVRTHAIAHELIHIRLEFEASAAGRARSFFQTPRTRKYFRASTPSTRTCSAALAW